MAEENFGSRIYSCRFMDELFFAVSGSEDVAHDFKSDVMDYLQNVLMLDVASETEIVPCAGPKGIRFLGTLVRRRVKDSPAVRAGIYFAETRGLGCWYIYNWEEMVGSWF